ncbi:MAG: MerR family transcriptional regulator [Hamadaea sp.]|nr:MerR family transcriptional regulator [Hamadaea sp.]
MLTIGEFAQAARLSPRALRLYDKLGLLRPAAVDDDSGYRFYHPDQVERGRLIAWLRQIDMPLDQIRRICDAAPDVAAKELRFYREQLAAQHATRQRLAAYLVDHVTGKAQPMPSEPTLAIRYAARTDAGRDRATNEDTAYADGRLLAVADGMRGAAGDRASAAAVQALLDADVAADDLLGALADAVERAQRSLGDIARQDPSGQAVTTLTAMLLSGSRLALVHIGDTRAYLLRDGELFQITHDHTYVQSMVDSGRLSAAEAQSHPKRAMLIRALTADGAAEPDLSLHDAHPGDRYLLCSDGLSAVVAQDALLGVLTRVEDPAEAVGELVALAYAADAPDNVACVVADVVPAAVTV